MTLLAIQFSKSIFLFLFMLFIGICLSLDLGVFSKEKHARPTVKESIFRTLIWATLGLLFTLVIWFFHHNLHNLTTMQDFLQYESKYGGDFLKLDLLATQRAFASQSVVQYISGYFVEYSLSLDNLFVMMLIFKSFKVNHIYEKEILFWGVIGAVVMRFVFIFIGGALIVQFNWILYIFGAFLVYSGFKLLLNKENQDDTLDTHNHPVVKFASKIFRISKEPAHGKFFLRTNGKLYVTSLFIVLLVIEFSDVIFAVDSVPAIFGITHDPYLVFFSNIFAILGLRSLYFLLGHGLHKFHTLQIGLSIILIYIGAKMLAEHWLQEIGFTHIHNLIVLLGILALSILFTFILPEKPTEESKSN